MPGDGFPFAVFICCEENFVGVFCRTLQVTDSFAPAVSGDVVGVKTVVDVNGELAVGAFFHIGREFFGLCEVSNVPDGGHDLVVTSEVFPNRFRLGRRLNDDQFLTGHDTPCFSARR